MMSEIRNLVLRFKSGGGRVLSSMGLRTTHPSKAYAQGVDDVSARIARRVPKAFHEIGMAMAQTLEDNPYEKD